MAIHRAFAPYIKLVAELSRFHGLDGRDRRPLRAPPSTRSLPPPAPLALTHASGQIEPAAASGEGHEAL
jgi:hypothetical protein